MRIDHNIVDLILLSRYSLFVSTIFILHKSKNGYFCMQNNAYHSMPFLQRKTFFISMLIYHYGEWKCDGDVFHDSKYPVKVSKFDI